MASPSSGSVLLLVLAVAACTSSRGGPSPDSGSLDAAAPDGNAADTVDGGAAACNSGGGGRAWAEWPMPAAPAGYDTTTPGVVIDRVTGLWWQRGVDPQTVDWRQAGAGCACLDLGGHRDWRLPSRIELVSIVDFTRHDPAIDGEAFPGTPTDWFWSSSPVSGSDPPAAWYVAFFDGNTHWAELTVSYHVRCVRGGPAPAPGRPRYGVGSDGRVIDDRTQLTWQQAVDGTRRPYVEAQAACAALALAGGGWRLPTMKELQTLVDESHADPAIDPTTFPDTPGEGFWASPLLAGTPGNAWFVSFANGIAYNSAVDHPYRVRCVR